LGSDQPVGTDQDCHTYLLFFFVYVDHPMLLLIIDQAGSMKCFI